MVSFQPHVRVAQGHSSYWKLNNAPYIWSLEENMDKYSPGWCSRYVSASDWDGQVETWGCRREGQRNEAEGNSALGGPQAAPRCIPSACVQPKHLMKSESALRSERFHQNKARRVILLFPHPLSSPFYLFVVLPPGHSCEDRSDGSSDHLWPWSGSVCWSYRQPIQSHLTLSVWTLPPEVKTENIQHRFNRTALKCSGHFSCLFVSPLLISDVH